MRRSAVIVAAFFLGALILTACGSQGVASPTPNTVVGTVSNGPTFPIVAAFHLTGDPQKGSSVYGSSGCGGCHTLAAAHSTGTTGPNLDQLKPDYRAATAQVTNGGGAMPSFKDSLTTQQIADVAQYVVKSTNSTP